MIAASCVSLREATGMDSRVKLQFSYIRSVDARSGQQTANQVDRLVTPHESFNIFSEPCDAIEIPRHVGLESIHRNHPFGPQSEGIVGASETVVR